MYHNLKNANLVLLFIFTPVRSDKTSIRLRTLQCEPRNKTGEFDTLERDPKSKTQIGNIFHFKWPFILNVTPTVFRLDDENKQSVVLLRELTKLYISLKLY